MSIGAHTAQTACGAISAAGALIQMLRLHACVQPGTASLRHACCHSAPEHLSGILRLLDRVLSGAQHAAGAETSGRSWLIKGPDCRLNEAVNHNGEAIKSLVNEQLGDGIMSAIDCYITVKSIKGKSGEDRVVVTMNGKYLPFIEQDVADMTS